jgi:hypothetical protein
VVPPAPQSIANRMSESHRVRLRPMAAFQPLQRRIGGSSGSEPSTLGGAQGWCGAGLWP